MEHRIIQPGQMIAGYAGYMRRGLTKEDAELAVERFKGEHPGQRYEIEEVDHGKFVAYCYATEEYVLPEDEFGAAVIEQTEEPEECVMLGFEPGEGDTYD